MHVAIDTKNLALYSGGIAAFARPLIAAWLAHRPDLSFSLIGPDFDMSDFSAFHNWRHVPVAWPKRWPRKLRHPLYDTVLFPRAVAKIRPQFLFSFYHDVRLPRPATGTRSAMMIHDTCLEDLRNIYPATIRLYYLAMLRLNLRRAGHVVTVSEASRARIVDRYGVPADRVQVIFNSLNEHFTTPVPQDAIARIRSRHGDAKLILYPGGSEYRKNIGRLLQAVARLAEAGVNVRLLVTGSQNEGWDRELRGAPALAHHVSFLGLLAPAELPAYYAAADAVAYPSLCEGFGRICIEAMATGTPLACSDLPVLREVAGTYPHYFDPMDLGSMTDALRQALEQRRPAPRRDGRFAPEAVAAAFTGFMDEIVPARLGEPARSVYNLLRSSLPRSSPRERGK